MMNGRFSLIINTILALAVLNVSSANASDCICNVSVTILVFSDIHEAEETKSRGGFARVATIVANERSKSKNTIVAFAGDTISPSLLSSFDQGAHSIKILNLIRPDVFIPGNHEFDFGEGIFRKRMAEASFPLLAANLREASGELANGFADRKLVEIEGVKIGLFGLTFYDGSTERHNIGNLQFLSPFKTAESQARALQSDGADLVVAVTHTDLQDDFRLVNNIDQIDLVLAGHDHKLKIVYDGRKVIAGTEANGANVVAVDLSIKIRKEGNDRRVTWTPKFRVIDTIDVVPDAGVAASLAASEASLPRDLQNVIGKTLVQLNTQEANIRSGENAFGNFIADAMLEATGSDVAIINGGAIRGDRIYESGTELTVKDIYKELPYDNRLVVLEVKGEDLKKVLDISVGSIGEATGRFGHISGARIVVKKDSRKIESVLIGGAPLDPSKLYKIAANDYIGRGSEGYEVLKGAKWLVDDKRGRLLIDVVRSALEKAHTISPAIDGRITLQ